jgi:inorganic phosphate transporter, PiT family
MRPGKALAISCLTELAAPLLLGTTVANTIGRNILDISRLTPDSYQDSFAVIFSALLGSIIWNLITWKIGLPSSSSHALIGGLIGAGTMIFGASSIYWGNIFWKIIVALLLTPVIGFAVGYLMIRILLKMVERCNRSVNRLFIFIQIFSMIFLASSHSSNDAQKSMGIIAIILVTAGIYENFTIPIWVILACAVAIAMGLSLGGWTIVKTVGTKIFKMKPIHSFSSQISAAVVIMASSLLGSPVSTSQIVSASIMGTGAGERVNAVNWGTVIGIVRSWVITIPCAAMIAAVIGLLIKQLI